MDEKGCDIRPRGNHIQLQMEKGSSGHWFLPVGRFSEAMQKMSLGHLATTSSSATDASGDAKIHPAASTTVASAAQRLLHQHDAE